jgi:hypothetical protein
MRASRAYIAGFGTAGSLLAGAAMVFVLASAVVAFRGWPQVGDQPPAVAIVAAQPRAPLDIRAVRRIASADRALAQAGAAQTASTASLAGRSVAVASTSTVPAVDHVTKPDQQSQKLVPVIGSAPRTSGCAGATCGPPHTTLSGTVTQTTSVLGTTVAAAGSAVASTVTGLTNSVAKTVAGLSPGLGKTVEQAGQVVGSTLSGATSSLGGVVTGAGNTLGQLLGAHH